MYSPSDSEQANLDKKTFEDGKRDFLIQSKRKEAFVAPNYAPPPGATDLLISVMIDKYLLLDTLAVSYDRNYVYSDFEVVLFWLCYDEVKKVLFWAVQAREKRSQIGEYPNGLFLNNEAYPHKIYVTNRGELRSYAKNVQGSKKDFDTLKGATIMGDFTFNTYSLLRLVTSQALVKPKSPDITISCLLLEIKDYVGNFLTLGYKLPDQEIYITGEPCPPLCYYL